MIIIIRNIFVGYQKSLFEDTNESTKFFEEFNDEKDFDLLH